MSKLKSRTGCLTCVARKKKCDEAVPTCGTCKRLALACQRRGRQPDGTLTTLPSTSSQNKLPPLTVTISSGFPPFESEFAKKLTLESPRVLRLQVSKLASRDFNEISLFGKLCTQDRMVREAVVAFSAPFSQAGTGLQLSLKSYQSCLVKLKHTRAYDVEDPAQKDASLIAILFLGLLEGLQLGDPNASITHFEMCRKLLVSRLSQPFALKDPDLVNIYRMAAESIIYNFAALSPFHERIGEAVEDWGNSFDCLFPTDDLSLSPFLGGFREIYEVMFRTNRVLRFASAKRSDDLSSSDAVVNLWQQLDRLERKIPTLYVQLPADEELAELYRAKHRVGVHSMRIHLIKISRPSATSRDSIIGLYFSKAAAVLKKKEVYEPYNPALRWPLTILACAARTDDDFDLIESRMKAFEAILDRANATKLHIAHTTIRRFRQKTHEMDPVSCPEGLVLTDTLDFLLEPRALDSMAEGEQTLCQQRLIG